TGTPLAAKDRIVVNIRLPGVKGSREEGKSSRSDELDVNGLGPFRALFLRILSEVENSISNNIETVSAGSKVPWMVWYGPPHSFSRSKLDTAAYVRKSMTCQKRDSRGSRRYEVE